MNRTTEVSVTTWLRVPEGFIAHPDAGIVRRYVEYGFTTAFTVTEIVSKTVLEEGAQR